MAQACIALLAVVGSVRALLRSVPSLCPQQTGVQCRASPVCSTTCVLQQSEDADHVGPCLYIIC